MKRMLLFVPLMFVALAGVLLAQASKSLTNRDVLEIVKAGFEGATIIQAIEANEPAFDTSAQALLELKNAGVSEPILRAMLAATRRKTETKTVSAQPSAPQEDIGI